MELISFSDLMNREWKKAVVVFKNESFAHKYSLKERSYEIYHTSNYFDSSKISTSLYGNCLDGIDLGVRLDLYMNPLTKNERPWVIDYCYIVE